MKRVSMQRLRLHLLWGLFLLLSAGCAGGPEPLGGEELLVMVYSTDHEPVIGGELRCQDRLLGQTDSFGRLIARGVSRGKRRFLVWAPTYAPKAFDFDLRDSTQILYVNLEPLGASLGRMVRRGESRALEELLSLMEEAQASREELTLVRALLLASRGEAGWREEIATLTGEIGTLRSKRLARAVGEILQ